MTDKAPNDARDAHSVERLRPSTPEPSIDRLIEKRRLVDFTEDLVNGCTSGLAVDAELLDLLQHPSPAAPANDSSRACSSARDAPVVEHPVARQSFDNAVDLVAGKAAPREPLP